jgi:hypothetical protein
MIDRSASEGLRQSWGPQVSDAAHAIAIESPAITLEGEKQKSVDANSHFPLKWAWAVSGSRSGQHPILVSLPPSITPHAALQEMVRLNGIDTSGPQETWDCEFVSQWAEGAATLWTTDRLVNVTQKVKIVGPFLGLETTTITYLKAGFGVLGILLLSPVIAEFVKRDKKPRAGHKAQHSE